MKTNSTRLVGPALCTRLYLTQYTIDSNKEQCFRKFYQSCLLWLFTLCTRLFTVRNIRDDIEQEDVEEAFYRYMEENPMAGVYMEDDEIVDYDEVGALLGLWLGGGC